MARKKDEAAAEPAAQQQQPVRRKRKKSDREGLSSLLLHLEPPTHRLITACVMTAALMDGGERSVARWCARVLEQAALDYLRDRSPAMVQEYLRKRTEWSDEGSPGE